MTYPGGSGSEPTVTVRFGPTAATTVTANVVSRPGETCNRGIVTGTGTTRGIDVNADPGRESLAPS